ncbi:MAG: type II toxin-antitoxin system HipA family toxin, partial [Candidatus Eisenbacteria bacterium]|nr:type II toxin-antitoxin system HipA family toxin [Candidatus Eisenbacteria bacterium]
MPAVDVAEVNLWGRTIGAVSWNNEKERGAFEYSSAFQKSAIELAPLHMPLGSRIYTFPELRRETFLGLPGMLADSLPDRFGNLLINQWLVREGRDVSSFSPVERLCYIGARGMGALEFEPALRSDMDKSQQVDVTKLVGLANQVLAEKQSFATRLSGEDDVDEEAMRDMLRVGTSAGGARAKAIVAIDAATGDVRSGQIQAPKGYDYWILKFDGVEGNRDKELNDPMGFGKVEYAYYLMAVDAGIDMMPSRLYHENGRSHFLTQRFDRFEGGEKKFMQTLCAINHMDYNQAGAYGYEQALQVMQQLGLPRHSLEQLYRRMVFNILARNQDDHTKNIAFLMDKAGEWSLAPAYDMTYSYNPEGAWT